MRISNLSSDVCSSDLLAYMSGGPAKFPLAADRAVEASNRLNVSYYRQDQIRLGMSYVISPRINADLRASCRIRRFALSPAVIDITQPRKERSYRLGGGLTWLANQRIGLSFDIDYQRRNASGTLFTFDGVGSEEGQRGKGGVSTCKSRGWA